jgi:hypothetical protein
VTTSWQYLQIAGYAVPSEGLVRGGTVRTLHVPLGRRDHNGHRVRFNARLQLDVHPKPMLMHCEHKAPCISSRLRG